MPLNLPSLFVLCVLRVSAVKFAQRTGKRPGINPRLVLIAVFAAFSLNAEESLSTRGEQLSAPVTGAQGSWRIGTAIYGARDILLIRFAPDAPPARMDSGIFIRGGSLLTGALTSIVGDQAEVQTSVFGPLKLKRDDIAGAFVPPQPGQPENLRELSHYCNLLAATLRTYGSSFNPGSQCRIVFAGLDELAAERVMRLGSTQILVAKKDKSVESINRQFVRLIELKVPPAPPSLPEDEKLGPEVVVRLKAGDLLRGRVVKLSDQVLTLRMAFIGDKDIPRASLALLFQAGATPGGVTWLSSLKPAKSIHVPVFDSEFPAVMDASVDGGDMSVAGHPLERGIGVHSRSELVFELDGAPRRLISLYGIDSETNGRGEVTARILADGKELWKSSIVNGKEAPKLAIVDLGSAKQLTLQVDYGPDGDDSGDHFDWGWAAVVAR